MADKNGSDTLGFAEILTKLDTAIAAKSWQELVDEILELKTEAGSARVAEEDVLEVLIQKLYDVEGISLEPGNHEGRI